MSCATPAADGSRRLNPRFPRIEVGQLLSGLIGRSLDSVLAESGRSRNQIGATNKSGTMADLFHYI
jgi:hypothetical protein